MRRSNSFGWLLVSALMLMIVLDAAASVLTIPNGLFALEGNSNNAVPFTFASRYQQVFADSEFSKLAGPALITTVSFRPDGVFGRPFSATIPGIEISLSTTQAAPDGLDPVFAHNIGVDSRIVFSGLLPLSSAFTGPAAGRRTSISQSCCRAPSFTILTGAVSCWT